MEVPLHQKMHVFTEDPRAGERLPYLVNDDGEIDPYVLAYSTARRKKLTPSTRVRALNAIIAVRLWAKIAGINVEQLMFYGKCLSTDHIESLKYYLHLTNNTLRLLAYTTPVDMKKMLNEAKRCNTSSFNNKLYYAWDYIAFIGQWGSRWHIKADTDPQLMTHRRSRLTLPVKQGKRSKRSFISGSIANEMLGDIASSIDSRINQTPTAQLNKFKLWLSVVDLSAIWKNEVIVARNRVLLDLLAKNGGRVGEILQIKNEDVDFQNRGIRIVRRHNDPDDPRKDEPNCKTHDRLVRFDERSWADLQKWQDIHFEMTATNDTQFIFISCSRDPRYAGYPMTARGVRDQIYQACDFAYLPRLRAHDLRHGSVRDLAEEAVRQKWTHEQWRKVATYLYGWSDQSGMPTHYVGDQWIQQAAEVMEKVWWNREANARALKEDTIPY